MNKNSLLDKVGFGILGLWIASIPIATYLIISQIIDNSKSVARVSINPRDEYGNSMLGAEDQFLAFDRNNDGKIDEIKSHYTSFGPRGIGAVPSFLRYTPSTRGFNELKEKYFPDLK